MRECPYTHGVDASMCKVCNVRCGFDPREITRRKNKINKGEGLSVNTKSLHHLKIERSK